MGAALVLIGAVSEERVGGDWSSLPPTPALIAHICNKPGSVCKHQQTPVF